MMLDTMRTTTLALLTFTALAAAACGSGGTGTGAGGSTSGSTTDAATASGAGGGATTGSTGGSGTSGATTSSGTGGAPEGTTITLTGVLCLDLATGATDSANPCKGDIVFLQGANVDLQSNGGAVPTFCAKPGTFQSLASIPKDYASCAWEAYVEGAVGLAKTGYVVRDAAGTHHYRFWIVDDKGSTITFQLEKID